jgi:hypothetical protein
MVWIILALTTGLIAGWVAGAIWAHRHFCKVAPSAYQEMRSADVSLLCDLLKRRAQ